MVWASPLSIATTQGITIVLFSSAYLDVSVQRVCLPYNGITHSHVLGCPIRTSADQGIFAPPRSFSQLITSFFASESLGILRTPLLLLSLRWPSFVKRPLFPLALLLKLCFFHNVNELAFFRLVSHTGVEPVPVLPNGNLFRYCRYNILCGE
jgi:hypothetical protein